MPRKSESFNWRGSPVHYLLLAGFQTPRSPDELPTSVDWPAALGEPPDEAIARFVEEDLLRPAPLAAEVQASLTRVDLEAMLRNRGLPVTGQKSDLIARFIQADPQAAEEAIQSCSLLVCTDVAQALADEYLQRGNGLLTSEIQSKIPANKALEILKWIGLAAVGGIIGNRCDALIVDLAQTVRRQFERLRKDAESHYERGEINEAELCYYNLLIGEREQIRVSAHREDTYRLLRWYDIHLACRCLRMERNPNGLPPEIIVPGIAAQADLNRALDPDYLFRTFEREEVCQLLGLGDAALTNLNQALSPNYSIALGQRGMVYLALGRYEAALAHLNRALELEPDYCYALAMRGQVYRLLDRYEAALADLNQALELRPHYVEALVHRGGVYLVMGRYGAALADLNRALELEPNNVNGIIDRGEMYLMLCRFDAALTDLNRALELRSDHVFALKNRGELHLMLGRYQAALEDLNQALELKPDYVEALAYRGDVYRQSGRYRAALADLSRTLKLRPDHRYALTARGMTYHSMGNSRRALYDFRRASR